MNYKHLIVALMVLAAGSPLAAQSVKAGIEAWQKADYPGAVAIWRPLAEKGDADAQFNLGQAYRLGRGVPTNLSAAQTWFERAGNQGHLDAQATLGLLLFQSGDQAGGLRWLKGAALKGEPRALLVYGTALFNGDGVTQDPVMGYAFVSRAAAQGLAPAKETLAQMDKILPLADRKKGVAIAIANAKKTPAPKSHTITVKPPKEPKPAPPAVAQAAPKPKPAPAVAQAAPKPKPAPVGATTPVRTGAWRIQLGAFSHRTSAEALFRKLSGSGALAGRQAFYIPVGAITRLQAGPFQSRGAASAACSALKGQACFVVAAK
jgi:TPR repeat protein